MLGKAERLRALLAKDCCHTMMCCWDGLSAKMIAKAGFPFTFMSGFATSASRIGAPDLGLMSYGETVDSGRNICSAVDIPVIGDGDTGYGNALNVKRTVHGYAQAGFAGVMIEDQIAPKRCGHTRGKEVVERDEALSRIRAAIDARDEVRALGGDILLLARTDARATHGLDEALWRARAFSELGADMLFVEAPADENELARIPAEVPGIHMANLVEGGTTPLLPPEQLHALGFRFAAYPLTLLSAAMQAMSQCLTAMAGGHHPQDQLMSFGALRDMVGFNDYYEAEARYACNTAPGRARELANERGRR